VFNRFALSVKRLSCCALHRVARFTAASASRKDVRNSEIHRAPYLAAPTSPKLAPAGDVLMSRCRSEKKTFSGTQRLFDLNAWQMFPRSQRWPITTPASCANLTDTVRRALDAVSRENGDIFNSRWKRHFNRLPANRR
jgi:hypothetical protein